MGIGGWILIMVFWAFTVLCSVIAVRLFSEDRHKGLLFSDEIVTAISAHMRGEHQNSEAKIAIKHPDWKKGDLAEDRIASITQTGHCHPETTWVYADKVSKVDQSQALQLVIDHLDLRYQSEVKTTVPAHIVKPEKSQ